MPASAGSSMKARNAGSNCAPTAPSTARWSQESVQVIWVRKTGAVDGHEALDAGTHGQDRGMRRVDDGGEFLDAIHAEIGNGRCAALIFRGQQFARPRPGGQVLHLERDLRTASWFRRAHNRREQSAFDRHRNANIANCDAGGCRHPSRSHWHRAPAAGRAPWP